MEEITYCDIAAAVNGDAVAINKIVDYYKGYIIKLSTKTIKTKNGVRKYVDEDMCRELETYLIAQILHFKIR